MKEKRRTTLLELKEVDRLYFLDLLIDISHSRSPTNLSAEKDGKQVNLISEGIHVTICR